MQHRFEKGVECAAHDFSSKLDNAVVQRGESPLVEPCEDHEFLFKFGQLKGSVVHFKTCIRLGSHGETSKGRFLGVSVLIEGTGGEGGSMQRAFDRISPSRAIDTKGEGWRRSKEIVLQGI